MDDDDIMEFDDDAELEWFYVEDDFSLADELAESQIPTPGYTPGAELDYESSEFDLYDYWMDLKYGEDEYWDVGGVGVPTSGEKRKRGMASLVPNKGIGKRRKLSLKDTEGGSVRFIPLAARMQLASRAPVSPKTRSSFALLPDWRQRFAGAIGIVGNQKMPMDMKLAAEADDQATPPHGKRQHAIVIAVESDDDEMAAGGVDFLQTGLASMDPKTLKAILKQKLGNAGLEGVDEAAFMQTIGKMLSGGEGAEDAAGELASSLLGLAAEGNDQAISGWLSQQGVTLDEAEDGDSDDTSVSVLQLSSIADKAVKSSTEASPRDSAMGSSKSATAELVLHGSSPLTGKKRSAPSEATGSAKKRRGDIAQNKDASVPNEDGDTISVSAPAKVDEDNIAVASSKKVNEQASTKNKKRSTKSNLATHPSANGFVEDGADEIKVQPPTTRTKRKRKIEADTEDSTHGSGESRQVKQAKRTAKPANEDTPNGRRTRSARTRVGR